MLNFILRKLHCLQYHGLHIHIIVRAVSLRLIQKSENEEMVYAGRVLKYGFLVVQQTYRSGAICHYAFHKPKRGGVNCQKKEPGMSSLCNLIAIIDVY